MQNRLSLVVPGVLAVVLWVVGLVVNHTLSGGPSEKASDTTVLAFTHAHANSIIIGSWLFLTGCLCLVWFAGVLRGRLAEAEGGQHTLAGIGFAGALAAAIFGFGTQADLVSGIDKNDISAATAGTVHHLQDLFFVGAELAIALLLVSTAVLGFRTRIVPRWWAIFSVLVAVVAWIGPIGWAALIYGFPVWILGTAVVVGRSSRAPRRVPAPAAA